MAKAHFASHLRNTSDSVCALEYDIVDLKPPNVISHSVLFKNHVPSLLNISGAG